MVQRDLVIGEIVGVHGIKGNLKLLSYAESLSVFQSGSPITIEVKGRERLVRTVKWAKPHKRIALLSLEDVTTIDQAQEFVGGRVLLDQDSLPDLDDGTYYWADLIGSSVYAADDRYVGRIDAIIPTGGNDVFVVHRNGQEILIPALESVVVDVDTENKRMRVDLPEGLE